MRAIYRPELDKIELNESIELRDSDFHHLVRVARLKVSDEVKVLLGNGKSYLAKIDEIDKKKMVLKKISNTIEEKRNHHLSLAIGINRPDTIKNIIQMSCELGFKKVYVIQTDYSSNKLIPMEKIEAILKMGVEQSNSVFLPEVIKLIGINDLIKLNQLIICFMNGLEEVDHVNHEKQSNLEDMVMLIGPEGGFSSREVSLLLKSGSVRNLCLNTPIMRTETAVATCFGFLLQSKQGQ